jgi:uncharacterized protein (TIGR00369 family)
MPKPQRTINPEHMQDAIRRYNSVGFNHHNNFVVDLVEPGHCIAHLEPIEESMNITQGIHGGAIATLCDIVTFLSVYCDIDEDEGMTTLDLNVSYLRPGKGKLIGEGRVLRQGKTVCLSEAMIYGEDGKLVAQATEKVYVAGSDKLMPMKMALELRDPDTPLPPKYLD